MMLNRFMTSSLLLVFSHCINPEKGADSAALFFTSTSAPSDEFQVESEEEDVDIELFSACADCEENCCHSLTDRGRRDLINHLQDDTEFMNLVCENIHDKTDQELTHAAIAKAGRDALARNEILKPDLIRFVTVHSGIMAFLIRSACANRNALILP